MRYIKREFCPITGESEFEILSDDEFPLFAGCVDPKEPNEDLVLNQQ